MGTGNVVARLVNWHRARVVCADGGVVAAARHTSADGKRAVRSYGSAATGTSWVPGAELWRPHAGFSVAIARDLWSNSRRVLQSQVRLRPRAYVGVPPAACPTRLRRRWPSRLARQVSPRVPLYGLLPILRNCAGGCGYRIYHARRHRQELVSTSWSGRLGSSSSSFVVT